MTTGSPSAPLAVASPHILLAIGGRGGGKTRMGAEWVNCLARGLPPFAKPGQRSMRIALVGETFSDVREVMIDGLSGIMAIHANADRADRPIFEAGRRRLVWPNGAMAQMFSSEDPEGLRGPQFDAAWCDELGKWKNADATWDMLQFGLRLGEQPRQIVTTTPRATPLMKRILEDPETVVRRLPTRGNAANLAKGFIAAVEKRYGKSGLGRQELEGELITERDGALWSRERMERCAVTLTDEERSALRRIVVAVDPPAGSGKRSDACGIVAAGLDAQGRAIVLADESKQGLKPADWARRVVNLYHRLEADCIIAEVNQGGDMVTAVIRTIDASVPVKAVRANRGKWMRAEPVQTLYEQGQVLHAGRFAELEDEMCDFTKDGLSDGRSPDRLDALVWAVGELKLRERAEPRVRSL